MRLWHKDLLPYLPNMQFKGQLREVLAIMRDWRDKGTTNHILINKIMEYPKEELSCYFFLYMDLYEKKYEKQIQESFYKEFYDFAECAPTINCYNTLHNKEYLRVCMANLYEKYLGVGKSKITDEEWKNLLRGYKNITGEDYIL